MTIPPGDRDSAVPDPSVETRWMKTLETFRGDLGRKARRELDGDLAARVDASDLVQETMLRAVRGLRRFRGRTTGELRGWVQAILASSLTYARRQHRGAARRGVGREVSLAALPDCAGGDETPSRLVMRAERDAAMILALLGLPERDRRAISLRYNDGLPFDEVGERLDISAEAARKLCARAIDRLRLAMGAADDPP